MAEASTSRFAAYSEEKEAEYENKTYRIRTTYSTNYALKLLNTFCQEVFETFDGSYDVQCLHIILSGFKARVMTRGRSFKSGRRLVGHML